MAKKHDRGRGGAHAAPQARKKRRLTPPRGASRRVGEEHPVRREEYAEFEQAQRERRLFNLDAWSAAVNARTSMPAWGASRSRSGIDRVIRKRQGPMVVDATGSTPVAKSREPSGRSPLEVAVVTVTARPDFVAGTLLVPLSEKDIAGVETRSLALCRWDERNDDYQLVHDAAVDINAGCLSGRITAPGVYAVVGVPSDERHLEALRDAGRPRLLQLATVLLVRMFDPAGPWRSLGPFNLSCCIMDVAIDPANADRLYAASSDGGVWRLDSVSSYPVHQWRPLTDGQPLLQIQCIAVSPADASVVYYVDAGGTLRRSADRGGAWTTPSTTNLGSARRIIAHPSDVNTVFVATWTGFWCTHDGGATWAHAAGQTTLRDGDMTDAAIDPADPSIIYVGQRGTGLLKSSNGGSTWQTVLPWSRASTPGSTEIRIAVGRGGTDATRTVAVRFDQEVLVNRRGGRDIGMPGGAAWTSVGKVGGTGYGWWCHVIAIDPFDDNVILSGAQELYRTSNGGGMWSRVITYYAPHEDQ